MLNIRVRKTSKLVTMTTNIQNQPSNRNMYSPLGFEFGIKSLPHVQYFCQSIDIPALSVNAIDVANKFTKVPYAADKVNFQELSIEFKIDEDWRNYREIFNWLIAFGFPEKYSQYKNYRDNTQELRDQPDEASMKTDCFILIQTALKRPNLGLTFRNAFPINLSQVRLSSTETDVNYVTATATFRFQDMVFEEE